MHFIQKIIEKARRKYFRQNSDFVFSVDVDEKVTYSNFKLLAPNKVPLEYIPERDSIYNFEYPEEYETAIAPFTYLKGLRARSIYFKLKPKTNRYSNTVGFNDAKMLFDNIIKSITEFSRLKAYQAIMDKITDFNRIEVTDRQEGIDKK